MIGKYSSDELDVKPRSEQDVSKLTAIFKDLEERVLTGVDLSEVEKEALCRYYRATSNRPPFNTADLCASSNFKLLYLTYFRDLTGGSVYYKPNKLQAREVPSEEAMADISYLRYQADLWGDRLKDMANADELMRQVIREYEFEIKMVNEQSAEFQAGFSYGGQRKYDQEIMEIRLHNKFIYYTAKEVFENFDNQQLVLTLNNKPIIINEFSVVHITNRHFAELAKKYKSGKSFHNENFHPKLLSKQLKDIFEQIENAGGLKALIVKEIHFKFKGDIYKIYTTDRLNYKGDIYLSTFFIVDDKSLLQKLAKDFNLVKVNDEISVYQPN